MLDTAVERYAHKPYLHQKSDAGWEVTSFEEAREKVMQLTSALVDLKIHYEDKIAIISEAKTDWIIAEFAALYAGAISVPLSIKLLPEEIPFRINHSDSKILLISENTIEKILSQWDRFEYKDLKLVIMDLPSTKISALCKQYNFKEVDLLFIGDLYKSGTKSLDKNRALIERTIQMIREDDVVTISYTSGTTGNPKGIMLTHLNYYSNSHAAVDTFQIKENISTLLILPTDHSFAHTVGIYTALVKGLAIYFVDARGGGINALKNIPINLVEANPRFLLTVPALTSNFMQKMKDGIQAKGAAIEGVFERGLKAAILRNGDGFNKPSAAVQLATWFNYQLAEKLIFKKLRLIFGKNIEFFVGGGALLDINQQQFYKAIGIPVYQGYGLTEATPIISTNTPFAHKMGTSGKVLGGITCKIADENGRELPKGEKGEIVIKGDNVMKGYYKNPKATEETIKNGWLHTGDLGYFDKDNFLVVTGREKALLISEDGEKYSPEEIEEVIANSSAMINQIMTYNDHKKYTTALVTLNKKNIEDWIKKNNMANTDQVLDKIKEEIFSFKKKNEFKNKFPEKWLPAQFQIAEEAFSEENKMINSTMKMVRFAILNAYQDRIDLMYGPNAQQNSTDKNKQVLGKMFKL